MKKIILIVAYIFMLSSVNSFAVTGDDLMNALCGVGETECIVCQDESYGKDPVFTPCKSYGTFNKDKKTVAENLDTMIGNYDEDKISRVCPMSKFIEKCEIESDLSNESSYIEFQYVWTNVTAYSTPKRAKRYGDGAHIVIDKKLEKIALNQGDSYFQDIFDYPSLDLIAEIKKVIIAEIDMDALLNKTDIMFNFLSYKNKKEWWENSMNVKNKGTYSLSGRGIRQHPSFTIKVPIKYKKKEVDVYCKSDRSLPCVSENKGKDYFCSTSPCGVISGNVDINPDQILPADNSTPTDNITVEDNVTSCDINDIMLFPGKQYKCRHKGEGLLSNDLTSPDQCLISDLDNNTKKAMLDGLNKFFDATSLGGGLGYLVAPGQLLIKLFTEGLIENIADMPTDEKKKLSVLRAVSDNNGSCEIVGEYCKDWSKTYYFMGKDRSECKRRASVYCCFDSPLAKAFNVAARDQIPKEITWGDNLEFIHKYFEYLKKPIRPDCRGITVDELGKINMDDPQFSEDMNAYVTDVLVPELSESGGMLDKKTLEEKQKKMQDDMKTFYE